MPAEYINKLQRMFQDIKVSEDLNQQFKNVYRITKGKFAGNLYYFLFYFTVLCIFYFIYILEQMSDKFKDS